MNGQADRWIMLLLALIAVILVGRGMNRWLRKPAAFKPGKAFSVNEHFERTPFVELLENAGYEVISGKLKVPLAFEAGDDRLYSRLFIDYVAAIDDEYYLVKTSRTRRPVEWTGSGVRDALLPYLLLYPDCAGVLYIDGEVSEIYKVRLLPEEED